MVYGQSCHVLSLCLTLLPNNSVLVQYTGWVMFQLRAANVAFIGRGKHMRITAIFL